MAYRFNLSQPNPVAIVTASVVPVVYVIVPKDDGLRQHCRVTVHLSCPVFSTLKGGDIGFTIESCSSCERNRLIECAGNLDDRECGVQGLTRLILA